MDKCRGVGWAALGAAVLAIMLLIPSVLRYFDRLETTNRGILKASSNCRQIITALKLYAAEHDGKYPDAFLTTPQSSNEVFRKLFEERIIDHELIFGSPASLFVPDGNIGTEEQGYANALEADENHWAMTAGMKDTLPGEFPLVYEDPVTGNAWPPRWNATAMDTSVRGRAWSGGILIGRNDGSVTLEKLESKSGTSVGLRKGKDGKDLFERAIDPVKFPKGVVLDILVEK